jgi:hypothetical protein
VKANPQVRKIELVIRWITRILSGMLVLFNGAYILLAILMITAAGEEFFPKMTFSFLALGLRFALVHVQCFTVCLNASSYTTNKNTAQHRLQRTAAAPLKGCTASQRKRDNVRESCQSRRCR